jgi:iron complex transport system permease protein
MSMMETSSTYAMLSIGPLQVRFQPWRLALCLLLAALLLAATVTALASGSGEAGLADLFSYLRQGRDAGETLSIIGDLRMPRVIMALLCGAMLGLSGAALQTLTHNGLADPGLLGVREGASLAVIALMLAFPAASFTLRPLVGMAGGLTIAVIAMALAGSLSRLRFILIGIGLSWLLSAVITLILTAADIDRVQAAMVWMAGSLSATTPDILPLAFVCFIIGSLLLVVTAGAADVGLLGEATAIGLGVRIKLLQATRLIAPVLLTAAAVSCAGSLGFVGLIAPHLSRLVIGGGQTPLLAGSAMFGAGLVLVADTLGRTLFAPLQIPAGIVLAVIGVPVLLYLLWRRRNQM